MRGMPSRRPILLAMAAIGAAAGFAPAGEANPLAAAAAAPRLVIDTQGFTSRVNSVDFSPGGDVLAAAGSDKVVRLWEVRTGRLLATLRGYEDDAGNGQCQVVRYSPDGRHLLVGVQDVGTEGAIRVYDTADLSEVQSLLPGHPNGGVLRLAFSADGKYLASQGGNGEVLFWDWPQRRPTARMAWTQSLADFGFPTAIPMLVIEDEGFHAFSMPHGREVTQLTAAQQGELAPPDVLANAYAAAQQPRRILAQIEAGLPDQGRSNVNRSYPAGGALREGRALLGGTGKRDGRDYYWVGVWTLTGRAVGRYEGHPYLVTALALSPDGSLVASADAQGNVDLWEAGTGNLRFRLSGKGEIIYSAGFDSSGTRLIYGTRPYGPGQWNYNHFAAPSRSFDLRKRTSSDAPSAVHDPPSLAIGARRLSFSNDPQQQVFTFTSLVGGRVEGIHRHPPGVTPLCFGYLSQSRTGIPDLLVVGGDDNGLIGLDPANPIRSRAFSGHTGAVYAVGNSPDGRLLVSGSADRTLRLWSLGPINDFGFVDFEVYPNGKVYSITPGGSAERAGVQLGDELVRIDGRDLGTIFARILAGMRDYRPGQRCQIELARGGQPFRVETEMVACGDIVTPLLNLFIAGDDWVLWTPSGYYDASPGADRLIGWQVSRGRDKAARFYTMHQFRKQFFRPEVIDRILQTGAALDVAELARLSRQKGAEPLDLRKSEDLRKIEPPRVKVELPRQGTHTPDKTIAVRAEVSSQNGGPIGDVKVLLNGRPVTGKDLPKRPDDAPTLRRVELDLELEPGRNTVSVLATDQASKSSSRPQEIVVYCEAGADDASQKPRAFVLAVGISDYANPAIEKLGFAHVDARSFAAAWKSRAGRLYADVQARVLTNQEATVAAIRDGFDWLNGSVTSRDFAVLFFAAHGVGNSSSGYYIASYEVDPKRLISTAIPDRDLISLVERLRCRRTLVFLDTCHAGGIAHARPASSESLNELTSDEIGAVMFGACKPRESSQEDPAWGHGAFTKALLETFADPARDLPPPDGLLSIDELPYPLGRRVADLTGNEQHTVVGRPPTIENFDFLCFPDPSKPDRPDGTGSTPSPGG